MDYTNVIITDFPDGSAREVVTENPDGGHTVLLNARLTREAQLLAYDHAVKHIEHDDFRKEDVQEIEANAHSTRCN